MRTLLIIFLVGFALFGLAARLHRAPSIVVENRTGREVAGSTLVVGLDAPVAADLGPGNPTGNSIPLRQEGPARLQIRFTDGTARVLDAGWFHPASRRDLRVVVADSLRAGAPRPAR